MDFCLFFASCIDFVCICYKMHFLLYCLLCFDGIFLVVTFLQSCNKLSVFKGKDTIFANTPVETCLASLIFLQMLCPPASCLSAAAFSAAFTALFFTFSLTIWSITDATFRPESSQQFKTNSQLLYARRCGCLISVLFNGPHPWSDIAHIMPSKKSHWAKGWHSNVILLAPSPSHISKGSICLSDVTTQSWRSHCSQPNHQPATVMLHRGPP